MGRDALKGMKQRSIIIYTMPETLEHKKGLLKTSDSNYYWQLSNPPKDFGVGCAIYFATKGFIRGFFICDEFDPRDVDTIIWNASSWTELKKLIPIKPFQGFKYFDNHLRQLGYSLSEINKLKLDKESN